MQKEDEVTERIFEMKIYVDKVPKEPKECLFAYLTQDYKHAKHQCRLTGGDTCRLCTDMYRKQCPYLERGVDKVDLLFT